MTNRNRAIRLFYCKLIALMPTLLAATNPLPAAIVTVDCAAESTEPSLSKSFVGVYQTPFWFKTHQPDGPDASRMVSLLKEADVHDVRYELAWGKPDVFAPNQVSLDTKGHLTLDPTALNPFLHKLVDARIAPLIVLSYCPTPLQHGTASWQRWKEVPDSASWTNICQQAASDWKFSHPAFEVWNEPDLPGDGGKMFFAGNAADYGKLYASTAAAVAPATVGGPATAYDLSYLAASGILDQHIDFVSIHAYANASPQLAAARKAMGDHRLPLRLTEYASYPTQSLAGSTRGYGAAAAFFTDVKHLLAEPGLEKVYWAQWVDDSTGMLTNDLHRRAIYNAYLAYQTLLPTPRRPTTIVGEGVDAMGASDANSAGVAAWNTTDIDQPLTIQLIRLPAARTAHVQVFHIDAHHASYGDDPAKEQLTPDDLEHATWIGTLPARSVVLLHARMEITPH